MSNSGLVASNVAYAAVNFITMNGEVQNKDSLRHELSTTTFTDLAVMTSFAQKVFLEAQSAPSPIDVSMQTSNSDASSALPLSSEQLQLLKGIIEFLGVGRALEPAVVQLNEGGSSEKEVVRHFKTLINTSPIEADKLMLDGDVFVSTAPISVGSINFNGRTFINLSQLSSIEDIDFQVENFVQYEGSVISKGKISIEASKQRFIIGASLNAGEGIHLPSTKIDAPEGSNLGGIIGYLPSST